MFQSLSPNVRGMLAMTAASVVFIFSDALMKLGAQTWPVSQMLAVRGMFSIVLMLAITIGTGLGRQIGGITHPLVVIRSATEAFIAITYITAITYMPIADLTSIVMLSPLVITAIANVFFGEQVGWRRWSAIVIGFLGLLLVVQPGRTTPPPGYTFAVALGLISVLGIALRDIVTRRMNLAIPSTIITLATSIGSCVSGLILTPFQPWQAFDWWPLFYCFVASLIVTAGNVLVVLACRDAELSVVAPFRYSSVIWAIGLGVVVFGDVPNALALVGMGVIVASGVYLMHRERVRMRERA